MTWILPLKNVEDNWMERANCIGEDDKLFFPRRGIDEVGANLAKAVEICRGCKVRSDCLNYALDNCIKDGVWGGLTPPKRKEYKRNKINGVI